MRLLVVEDESELAEAIARGLRHQGYAVDIALNGVEAFEKFTYTPYDLLCVDVTMPEMDGRELCRKIRAMPDIVQPKILFLTALDALDQRVDALNEGGDEYLTKPFAFSELQARIRVLLRRDSHVTMSIMRYGDIELDEVHHLVTKAKNAVELTAKEFALLRYFLIHPEKVHSQETLLEHVWDEFADPFTNTVRVTVSTLRKKLLVFGSETRIETKVGKGYRLIKDSDQ